MTHNTREEIEWIAHRYTETPEDEKELLTQLHHQLQKAREEERERIKQWVKQRISHEIGNVIAASEGAYRPTEIEIAEEEAHNQAIKCVLKFLDHSELDQDNK